MKAFSQLPPVGRRLATANSTVERFLAHAGQFGRALLNHNGTRRQIARRYLFPILGALSPVIATEHDDIIYCIRGSDRGLGRQVFSCNGYDNEILRVAISALEELRGPDAFRNRTFIDIGANLGITAIPAVKSYGAAKVVAFEPAADTFKLLQCNIILNGLESNIQALCLALSDASGEGRLEVASADSGDNRIRVGLSSAPDLFDESSRAVVPVALARLDDVLRDREVDIGSIALVWIDAQGHEAQILDGAHSILESDIPVVLEYWPYGLRRANGLTRLHDIIRTHFTKVIDLRAPRTIKRMPSPADLLRNLERELDGPDFTDLLLLH